MGFVKQMGLLVRDRLEFVSATLSHTFIHAHVYIYMYIYIYVYVRMPCVCVCIYICM